MKIVPLVLAYCRARNLDYKEYLTGLFNGLTPENIPPNFIETQIRYHKDWLK